MKKLLLSFLVIGMLHWATAQDISPRSTIKWAPAGLILGNIGLQGEYHIKNKNSLTAKIGIPINAKHTLQYEDKDASFTIRATSVLLGYRHYLSKKQLSGLYIEPYIKYVHHTGDGYGNGMLDKEPVIFHFTNNYNGAGIGAQLGAQFIISKRVVIDLFFLGPEVNTATNHFKAIETTHAIPWTNIQASDAEKSIRDFVHQFPVIGNKVNIKVDQNQRAVLAGFNGLLPGLRTGISFGIAL